MMKPKFLMYGARTRQTNDSRWFWQIEVQCHYTLVVRFMEFSVFDVIVRWMKDYLQKRHHFSDRNVLPISMSLKVLCSPLILVCQQLIWCVLLPRKVIMFPEDFTICVTTFWQELYTSCVGRPQRGLEKVWKIRPFAKYQQMQNAIPFFANEFKILCVIFDCDGDWNAHIDSVIKCAFKRLFYIRVLKWNVTENDIIIAFISLVRSILEYCTPLFTLQRS